MARHVQVWLRRTLPRWRKPKECVWRMAGCSHLAGIRCAIRSATGQLQRRLPEAAEAAERQPAAEQEVAAHARLARDVEH